MSMPTRSVASHRESRAPASVELYQTRHEAGYRIRLEGGSVIAKAWEIVRGLPRKARRSASSRRSGRRGLAAQRKRADRIAFSVAMQDAKAEARAILLAWKRATATLRLFGARVGKLVVRVADGWTRAALRGWRRPSKAQRRAVQALLHANGSRQSWPGDRLVHPSTGLARHLRHVFADSGADVSISRCETRAFTLAEFLQARPMTGTVARRSAGSPSSCSSAHRASACRKPDTLSDSTPIRSPRGDLVHDSGAAHGVRLVGHVASRRHVDDCPGCRYLRLCLPVGAARVPLWRESRHPADS